MTVRDISYVGEGLIPAPLHGGALRYTPLPKDDVTDIAVHHMTGWNPPPNATPEMEIRFLRGIDEWHRSSRGLDGIGYHLVPMASGRVYITSRLDRYGAHVGYENNHLLGVALPGDYSTQLPSPGHLAAAVEAVRHIYGYLGRDVPTKPHLYWDGTTCPGARWPEWVPQLQGLVTEEEEMTPEQFQAILDCIGREAKATRDYVEVAGVARRRETVAMVQAYIELAGQVRRTEVIQAFQRALQGQGVAEADAQAIVDEIAERLIE